jgi:NAD-dependent DNA ligase adenylation domain
MSKGKTKSEGRGKKGLQAKPVAELDEGEASSELKRLAKVIAYHDELYYRLDAPEISDAEYDALRERNAAIEARFPRLIRKDSPSLRIGAPPVEAFGKVVHRVPMLSLGNVFDDKGVREFLERVRRFLGLESIAPGFDCCPRAARRRLYRQHRSKADVPPRGTDTQAVRSPPDVWIRMST